MLVLAWSDNNVPCQQACNLCSAQSTNREGQCVQANILPSYASEFTGERTDAVLHQEQLKFAGFLLIHVTVAEVSISTEQDLRVGVQPVHNLSRSPPQVGLEHSFCSQGHSVKRCERSPHLHQSHICMHRYESGITETWRRKSQLACSSQEVTMLCLLGGSMAVHG